MWRDQYAQATAKRIEEDLVNFAVISPRTAHKSSIITTP